MTNKLYLPSTSIAPTVSPAYNPLWDGTASAVRVNCPMGSPSGTGLSAVTLDGIIHAAGVSGHGAQLYKQFVTPELMANSQQVHTWLDTGYILCSCNAVPATDHVTFYPIVLLSICDSTGAIQSTASAIAIGTNMSTVLTNRRIAFPLNTLPSAYTIANRDRLVIEVGVYCTWTVSANPTTFNATLDFRDDLSDLPSNQTNTSQGSSWMTITTASALTQYAVASNPKTVKYSHPTCPVHAARKWQYPPIADRNSGIASEFVGGAVIL